MLTIFGFYTDDHLYTKHAQILKASAERLGIPIDLRVYPKKEWQSIIAFKPSFIAQMRRELKGPLLFVDADAIILEDIRPYYDSIVEDIAVHYLNDTELLSGTLFINDTANAHNLMNEWEKRQLELPQIWDQKVLELIIQEWLASDKITLKRTPARYTYIFDISKMIYGAEVKPAIAHLQASRDIDWIRRYNQKTQLAQFSMHFALLSKTTRKLKKRHDAVNKITQQLGIDLKLSVHDLIE